mmetsp:Transcript_4799/g.9799  ORF Transcript_4799/g.9799 Transcript_4799/m.9799 type:complete len:348 (+) Transcript_4799:818-1861(+)
MRVVDHIELLATLRTEGADLPVAPAADDTFTICHKGDARALQGRDLNPQKLSVLCGVPDANFRPRSSCEHLAVALRERNVVDLFAVVGLLELSVQGVGGCVIPHIVHGGVCGANKESEGLAGDLVAHHQGRNTAWEFNGCHHVKRLLVHHANGTISCPDHHMPERGDRRGDYASRDFGLRPNILEELIFQSHLQQISGGCTAVRIMVLVVNNDGLHDALELTEMTPVGAHFTVSEVEFPHVHVPAARSDNLCVGCIQELNAQNTLVRGGATADGTAGFRIPHHETVVVLTTDRRQEAVIEGEGQCLNLDLVQAHAMTKGARFQVPDDDVRAKAHVCDLSRSEVPPGA